MANPSTKGINPFYVGTSQKRNVLSSKVISETEEETVVEQDKENTTPKLYQTR